MACFRSTCCSPSSLSLSVSLSLCLSLLSSLSGLHLPTPPWHCAAVKTFNRCWMNQPPPLCHPAPIPFRVREVAGVGVGGRQDIERQRERGRGATKGKFSPPLHTLPHFILAQPRAEGFVSGKRQKWGWSFHSFKVSISVWKQRWKGRRERRNVDVEENQRCVVFLRPPPLHTHTFVFPDLYGVTVTTEGQIQDGS